MKVFILFILLVSAFSCGNPGRKPSTESQLGNALSAGGEYGANEKNIALRICYAFKSKNTNYRASFLNAPFNFNLTSRNCEADEKIETLNTILKAPLASQPIIFDAISDIPYYQNVQTDKAGVLGTLCSSLISGGNPAKSNMVGAELIEISFLTSDIDNIIVSKASLSGANYVVNQEERFSVDTSTSAGNRIGQVKVATRERVCANGRVESLSQILTP
jgi:hypothetical protein